MSDLLNKASLVMIPSGYKEDVVYSAVPGDGSGDMAFTRATNGTRVNSAGLVEVCPWNLVSYSEQFANAFWSVDNGTITANSTTAPNGTTTADTFTKTIGSTAYLYNGSFNLGIGQFTQSIYAKANASSSIRLEFVTSAFGNGAACIFDLSNGTAGSITIYGGVSGFTASIESVGNGWYRCSLGGTITIADTYYYEISITTGSIYIWGAQLNIGSTAKPYFPTTDRLNVPRLTYQNGGGGCPSLLLEKQSTNSLLYSEQFDNAGWTKTTGTTITANSTTSPDGTQNAETLTVGTTIFSGIYQIFTTSTNPWTTSIFVKKGTKDFIYLFDPSTHRYAWFNLNTGAVGQKTASTEAEIISVGNGWYRISVTASVTGNANHYFQLGLSDADGSFTPSSSGTAFIWGAQAEASSYPTSYIPTTSSSATRVVDQSQTALGSSIIGQSEGVLFLDVDFSPYGTGVYNNPQTILIRNGSSYATYLYIASQGITGQIVASIVSSGLFIYLTSSQTLPNRFKCALAYKSGDTVFYVNGNLAGTSTTTFSPLTLNDLRLNHDEGSLKINEVAIFKTRLTNAELASLTTI